MLSLFAAVFTAHISFGQTYIYDPPGSFTGLANVANWDQQDAPDNHPSNFTDAGPGFYHCSALCYPGCQLDRWHGQQISSGQWHKQHQASHS